MMISGHFNKADKKYLNSRLNDAFIDCFHENMNKKLSLYEVQQYVYNKIDPNNLFYYTGIIEVPTPQDPKFVPKENERALAVKININPKLQMEIDEYINSYVEILYQGYHKARKKDEDSLLYKNTLYTEKQKP